MKILSAFILVAAPAVIGILMGPVLDLILEKIISGLHSCRTKDSD